MPRSRLRALTLLVATSLCIAPLARAITWTRDIGPVQPSAEDRRARLKAIAVADDGSVFAAGLQHVPGMTTSINGEAWLVKLDPLGEIAWQVLANGTLGLVYDVEALPDGGAVVVGHTRDHSLDGDVDLWFWRVDAEGETVWSQVQQVEDGDQHFDIQWLDRGRLAITGLTFGPMTGWILELREDGSVFQRHTYTQSFTPGQLVERADGGYVFAGGQAQRGGFGPWVGALSPTGEIEWDEQVAVERSAVYCLGQAADGSFVAAGRGWREEEIASWVLRFSGDGELHSLSRIDVDEPWPTAAHDCAVQRDGGVIFVGTVYHPVTLRESFWAKVDARDEIAWSGRYVGGPGTASGAEAVATTAEGGFVACTSESFATSDPVSGLIRLNPDGTADAPCPGYTPLGFTSSPVPIEPYVWPVALGSGDAPLVDTADVSRTTEGVQTDICCPLHGEPAEAWTPDPSDVFRVERHDWLTWGDGWERDACNHDVFRGRVSELRERVPPTCLVQGVDELEWRDDERPGTDDPFYYLLRGRNLTRVGPLGTDSQGRERLPSMDPCP